MREGVSPLFFAVAQERGTYCMEAYWAAKNNKNCWLFLLLCAFLFTSLFTVQPTTAWAGTADEDISLTLDNLAPGTYYVDVAIASQKVYVDNKTNPTKFSVGSPAEGATSSVTGVVGIKSGFDPDRISDSSHSAKLIVGEDGSRHLQFTFVTQRDRYSDGTYFDSITNVEDSNPPSNSLIKLLLQVSSTQDSATDLLPGGYTQNQIYDKEPTAELQQQYGFSLVDVTTETDTYQIMQRRFEITADVEKNDDDTYNDYIYLYAVHGTSARSVKVTFSNPTMDEKDIDISKRTCMSMAAPVKTCVKPEQCRRHGGGYVVAEIWLYESNRQPRQLCTLLLFSDQRGGYYGKFSLCR